RLWRLPRLARRAVNKAKRTVGRRTWGAVEHPDPTAYYDAMQSSAPPEVLARVAPGLVDSFGARRPPGLDGGLDLRSLAWFSQRREFEFQLPRILRKVDQASMHHSLEVRVPLLDPDVIATALRVDPAWTLRQTGTKPVLRRLLDDRLGFAAPRPKLGFGAPMGEWMATDLREPIDDVLRHGLDTDLGLATDEVERCWRAQLSGEADHRMLLWGLACLGWWRGRVRSMTP
ncbi:MAG: asparagine synthase-related protein, partial [Actinomycetota bacterium]